VALSSASTWISITLIHHHHQKHHKADTTSKTTISQHKGWSIINISTRLRVFGTRLASQHEAGNTTSLT
jgi:hypothetical protein